MECRGNSENIAQLVGFNKNKPNPVLVHITILINESLLAFAIGVRAALDRDCSRVLLRKLIHASAHLPELVLPSNSRKLVTSTIWLNSRQYPSQCMNVVVQCLVIQSITKVHKDYSAKEITL